MNPAEGYRVADVIVDGVSIGAVLEATFGAIAGNHSIEVIFEPI
jgi:hypothetical protein